MPTFRVRHGGGLIVYTFLLTTSRHTRVGCRKRIAVARVPEQIRVDCRTTRGKALQVDALRFCQSITRRHTLKFGKSERGHFGGLVWSIILVLFEPLTLRPASVIGKYASYVFVHRIVHVFQKMQGIAARLLPRDCRGIVVVVVVVVEQVFFSFFFLEARKKGTFCSTRRMVHFQTLGNKKSSQIAVKLCIL